MLQSQYDKFGLYIDGQWTQGKGEQQNIIDPATEEKLGCINSANHSQIQQAIKAAQSAQLQWQKLNTWERAEKMQAIAHAIRANGEQIANTISTEVGKPIVQAQREIELAYEQFIWFSEQTKRIKGEVTSTRLPNTKSYIEYEPVGVCAAFSSWNFPLTLVARKVAPAIAAGCPIIIRATEAAPLTNMLLVECCHQAGLPNGMITLLCGKASEIADVIMNSPVVRKISLTGSTEVGKLIMAQSAQTLKKVTMELGGHAPVIVHSDIACVNSLAKLATAVKSTNSGQVCVSPTRFFVHESLMDEFCDAMVNEAQNIILGNGLNPKTTMGPLINQKRLDAMISFMETTAKIGGNILTGGKRSKQFKKGYFFEPTIIRDLPEDSRLMCEEIFGPITLINSFSHYDEVIKKANHTDYALAAYTFTRSLTLAEKTRKDLVAGMVGINTFLVGHTEVPFGGIHNSGMGRENGELGIHEYLNSKMTTIQTEP